MNKVVISGNILKFIYRNTGKVSSAFFIVKTPKKYRQDGGPKYDSISCKAFGQRADFMNQYFKENDPIEIDGHLESESMTHDDGAKSYSQFVIVDNVEFAKKPWTTTANASPNSQTPAEKTAPITEEPDYGFVNYDDDDDNEVELPFN